MSVFRRKTALRDYIAASEWNEVTRILSSLLKASGTNAMVDSTGIHSRKPLQFADHRIATINSNTTGGGYYNCSLMAIDSEKWDTTNTEHLIADTRYDEIVVLNIAEEPIEGDTSSHKLTQDTMMEVWQVTDDEGNFRWIGHEIARYYDCNPTPTPTP